MKILTVVYMIGLPCYFHGIWKGFVLFFVGHLTCGEMLATMFIVNHVIEGVAFAQKTNPAIKKTGESKLIQDKLIVSSQTKDLSQRRPKTVTGITPMEATYRTVSDKSIAPVPLNDWAAVQCQTSVNWASESWFWNHFSGGLSHQIEHHLFPGICHTNYVYIQPVVEQTCREFGVPYQNEPSLYSAYTKMIKHLKFMGNEIKKE